MTRLIRIEPHENGPRLWLLGDRVRWHHWTSGVVLVAVGVRLIWRDRLDLPYLTERTP